MGEDNGWSWYTPVMREGMPIPEDVMNPGPTSEAKAQAENYIEQHVLTEQERRDSEVRVKNFRQELADFELTSTFVDADGERLPPSPEDVEQLNDRLTALGRLFADSGLEWRLDGAVNISLYKENVIGRHKDVDITVMPEKLEQLEAHLARQGYGLFISEGWNTELGDKSITLQRADAKAFRETDFHRMIAAIDGNGQIRHDTALNFIDTHLLRTDEAGHPQGYYEVPLPPAWFVDQKVNVGDQEIRCSHPALVAYHKLHNLGQGRKYDLTDCEQIAALDNFTSADLETISRVLDQEQKNRYRDAADFMERMGRAYRPDMTWRELEIEFLSDPQVVPRLGVNLSADTIRGFAKVMFEAIPQGLEEAQRVTLKAILAMVPSYEREGLDKMRVAYDKAHNENMVQE